MTANTANKPTAPWLLLISRSILFLLFQSLIAFIYVLVGQPDTWKASARWWVLVAIFTNLVSIWLLSWLFRKEGKRYLDILRFSKATAKKDILWMLATSVVGIPLMGLPLVFLAPMLFNDPNIPVSMMFQPLPSWALIVGLLFPITIAFAELPTYFGYVMPKLAVYLKNGWAAWLIAAFFLAFQHGFLPLIFDGRFVLWRLGLFLPFALFSGFVIKLRPSLLPYFAVIHALLDFATLSTYLML